MNARATHRQHRRTRRAFRPAVVLVGAALCCAPAALAQENDECLMCHEDADLTGTRGGDEISVYFDAGAYADAGTHADADANARAHAGAGRLGR